MVSNIFEARWFLSTMLKKSLMSIIGISRVLEWQLRNIQANFGKEENKRTFGIQYPNIDGKDDDPSQTFCGLVVFTWEASEVLQNGFSRICESRIIQAVKNKKGPFILCLKHAEQLSLEKCVNQLKLAAENLQKFLQDSHKLVWTELPLGKLVSHSCTLCRKLNTNVRNICCNM